MARGGILSSVSFAEEVAENQIYKFVVRTTAGGATGGHVKFKVGTHESAELTVAECEVAATIKSKIGAIEGVVATNLSVTTTSSPTGFDGYLIEFKNTLGEQYINLTVTNTFTGTGEGPGAAVLTDEQRGGAGYGSVAFPSENYRTLQFVSETFGSVPEKLVDDSIKAGRLEHGIEQVSTGKYTVGGDVVFNVQSKGQGILWKHYLGSVTTTELAPATEDYPAVYEHVYTRGTEEDSTSLSIQKQIGTLGTEPAPITYGGCVAKSVAFKAEVEKLVQMTWTFFSQRQYINEFASVPNVYPNAPHTLSFARGTVECGGALFPVKTVTSTPSKALDESRYNMRGPESQYAEQPYEIAERMTALELTAELNSIDFYNSVLGDNFLDGQSTNVVINLEGELLNATLREGITLEYGGCVFEGETPKVSGKNVVMQTLKAEAYAVDEAYFSVRQITTDATP